MVRRQPAVSRRRKYPAPTGVFLPRKPRNVTRGRDLASVALEIHALQFVQDHRYLRHVARKSRRQPAFPAAGRCLPIGTRNEPDPLMKASTRSSPGGSRPSAAESASTIATKAELRSGLRRVVVGALKYATNYIVAHTPSYTIRHFWYRHLLGIDLARGTVVHMGSYIYFNSPRSIRRSGVHIGQNSRIES